MRLLCKYMNGKVKVILKNEIRMAGKEMSFSCDRFVGRSRGFKGTGLSREILELITELLDYFGLICCLAVSAIQLLTRSF